MIGLALVSFVAVFAAGIKGSIDDAIDKTLIGDLTISNEDGFSDIPIGVRDEVAAIDGLEVASALLVHRRTRSTASKGTLTLVDPSTAAQVLHLDWDEGSGRAADEPRRRRGGGRRGLRHRQRARGRRQLRPTISGDPVTLTVVGTFTDNSDFMGDYGASDANAEAFGEAKTATNVFINLEPDADADAVRARDRPPSAQPFPTVQTAGPRGVQRLHRRTGQPTLGDRLRAAGRSPGHLAFEIVNTLALSIHERTRELGLLRAVGTSRRQIRRMVRYEAVITALIGAVLGLALGVLFAVIVSRPLADEGFTLSIPVGQLIGLLVLAALAGVLAAIGPAPRAPAPGRTRSPGVRVVEITGGDVAGARQEPGPRKPSAQATARSSSPKTMIPWTT